MQKYVKLIVRTNKNKIIKLNSQNKLITMKCQICVIGILFLQTNFLFCQIFLPIQNASGNANVGIGVKSTDSKLLVYNWHKPFGLSNPSGTILEPNSNVVAFKIIQRNNNDPINNNSFSPKNIIEVNREVGVSNQTGVTIESVLTLTNSGKLGLATQTPKEQFQIGDLWTFHNGGSKFIGYNIYYDGQGKRIQTGVASLLGFDSNGDIAIKTAESGALNSQITFNTGLTVKPNGNVGIGHSIATEKLDVNGNAKIRGNLFANGSDILLGMGDGRNQGIKFGNRALVHTDWGTSKDKLVINYDGDFEGGVLVTGPQMTVDGNTQILGKLSVGTSDPKGYQLAVAGRMIAEEVRVKLQGAWPDYVFEQNYQLMPLKKLEEYIANEKHLPNLPSSDELKAQESIDLLDMNKKLLEKIEELTLYVIELNKQVDILKKDKSNMEENIQNPLAKKSKKQ